MNKIIYFFLLCLCIGCYHKKITTPNIKTKYSFINIHGNQDIVQGNSNNKHPINWWKQFNSPALNKIISKSLDHNFDLKLAEKNSEIFLQSALKQRAALFPQIDGALSYQNVKRLSSREIRYKHPYATLNAIWEIDLFGKNREIYFAKKYQTLSTEQIYQATKLSLVSDLASKYFQLLSNLEIKTAIEKNISLQKSILNLIEIRHKSGVSSGIDKAQSEYNLLSLEALLPETEALIKSSKLAIEKLCGLRPNELNEILKQAEPITAFDSKVYLKTADEVINQRPDILASQYKLIAQKYLAESSKKLYLPTISLSSFFGGARTKGQIFDIWNLDTPVSLPILNFGRIKSEINIAKSEQEKAFLELKKTINDALHEIEFALVNFKYSQNKYQKSLSANQTSTKLFEIAQAQYKSSIISYINLLDAEREIFESKVKLIDAKNSIIQNFIHLNRVIAAK